MFYTGAQPPVAQLPAEQIGQLPVAHVPWAHNVLLMQRVKDQAARRWYMQHTLANGWSRDILALQIQAKESPRSNIPRLMLEDWMVP